MSFPEEQKRIDVTLEEKHYQGKHPVPRKKKARARKARRPPLALKATFVRLCAFVAGRVSSSMVVALPWLRRPVTLLAMAVLVGACAFAWSRPPVVEGPALPTLGWKVSAFPAADAKAAIDGDRSTRWVAQGVQVGWFAADMRKPQAFHQVVMDSGANDDGYPHDYSIYVSGDGRHWGSAIATGAGTGPVTIASFPKQTARYVKVMQVSPGPDFAWSLCEFTVH